MGSYKMVTTMGDFGPWVSKLILELPCEVGENDVAPGAFNVFCARKNVRAGEVIRAVSLLGEKGAPSQGFVPVTSAYPCDEQGCRSYRSTRVALELPECRLTKRIEGSTSFDSFGYYVESCFRVTQLEELPSREYPVTGLVFEDCAGEIAPALDGWSFAQSGMAAKRMRYAYFEPELTERNRNSRLPLIVWLHGAGEGGEDPRLPVTANRVTALSQDAIQGYFGGAAWVLAPQSPNYWMNDGMTVMSRSNLSVYVEPLKALIDEFVADHAARIDTSRIVLGGLSNGGFMTVRMLADYPGFFSAGIPVCAPFYDENQSSEVVEAVAATPTWFVHSRGDLLVNAAESSLPLYRRLSAAGAETHFTLYDHVEDLTGVYREPDGRPRQFFNHCVWIHVYNDFCRTDLDGRAVMCGGMPVGLWEWAAEQRL